MGANWALQLASSQIADTTFLQYGAVGGTAVLALTIARNLFKKMEQAYEREKTRGDRLEQELAKLNQTIQDHYLTGIQEAMKAVADAQAKIQRGPQ